VVDLLDVFDRTYVLNLPERTDRRRETRRELELHFADAVIDERVRFFDAIRPEDQGPFRSRGSHGCFLSFLEMLTAAEADGLGSVLILQDDVSFTPAFDAHRGWLLDQVGAQRWDYLQLGYLDVTGATTRYEASAPVMVDFDGEVIGAHCIGFIADAVPPMLEHLHAIREGEPGDPLRGPMSVDGAFNTFKWCHPSARRLLPVPNMAAQRSSRSDITPRRHDRIPAMRPVLDGFRASSNRFRQSLRRRAERSRPTP
jgi:glycosyl transferase, family 25